MTNVQKFIGVKLISAVEMNRATYNEYRGWPLPENENGDDAGYLVEYLDGGKPNDPRHDGYISWSPKDVFEAAYRPCTNITFGLAIEALKQGKRVARAGWNGKGMWLSLTQGYDYSISNGVGALLETLPWIGMKTADEKFVPWLASQTDMLAEDWVIVG